MPIYAPGIRDRHNRRKSNASRNVIASLSLTAMVDMFTVLAVFLLQNYQTTGEVIELKDDVKLPRASAVKELKPANVIMVSPKEITLDKVKVIDVQIVRNQPEWDIPILAQSIAAKFRLMEEDRKLHGLEKIREAVDQNRPEAQREKPEDLRRVTVQADKSIDFLTIKKVIYTLYNSGASEVNFAVLKDEKGKK